MRMANLERLRDRCHGSFKPVVEAVIQCSNNPEYLEYWTLELYRAAMLDRYDDAKALAQLAKGVNSDTRTGPN